MTERLDTDSRATSVEDGPLQPHIEDFERYLRSERGLAESTIHQHCGIVQRFSSWCAESGRILEDLGTAEVAGFLLHQRERLSVRSLQVMAGALRAFFRFLRLHGTLTVDLAGAVPRIARWHLSEIPKSLPVEHLRALLESCDRSSDSGRRNYAILLLLARLGLRGGEIVTLRLEDFDWRAGELSVRGKGSRRDRLPIPAEVGEAVVAYLHHGRPQCASRRLFVTLRRPHRGLAGPVCVSSIVSRALSRAGIESPRGGAHLLRHTLATQMLRRGASMSEIAQVLRHRSTSTTEIYAKVDHQSLRELAQPWPGGVS